MDKGKIENLGEKELRKRAIYDYVINFAIAIFFYSVFKVLLKELFPSLLIGALPTVILLGAVYFFVSKARSSQKGKNVLYDILVAFIIFPLLAVNIGKFISTDSVWPVFPLAIFAYILAKPVRIILKKVLAYAKSFLKSHQRKT